LTSAHQNNKKNILKKFEAKQNLNFDEKQIQPQGVWESSCDYFLMYFLLENTLK